MLRPRRRRPVRRPRAMLGFGAVLLLLAVSFLTLFALTRGLETSVWVSQDPARAELLGVDARAREMAAAAEDPNVAGYLDDAAQSLTDEARLPRWDFDVNDAYGIAFIDDGGVCHQLISGPGTRAGSVVPCLDTPDIIAPTLDELAPVGVVDQFSTLSVRATDNRLIDHVEFQFATGDHFYGTAVLGTRTGWTRTWTAPAVDAVAPDGPVDLCARAYDTSGNVADTCVEVISSGLARPDAPTIISSESTSTSVELTFERDPDEPVATGYWIHVAAGHDSAFSDATTDNAVVVAHPGSPYSVTGLAPGSAYTFWVTGVNGASAPSAPSAPHETYTAPSTPTALDVSAIPWTPGSLSITFAGPVPSEEVTGYRVYRDGVLVHQGPGTAFIDSGLTGDLTAYVYTVTAYNSGGESDPTDGVSAVYVIPQAPTITAVNATTATSLTPVWTAPAHADSYDVQRSGDLSFATVGASASALTTTAWADTTLSAAPAAHYRVRACNSLGCSDWSAPFTATPPASAPTLNATPVDLTVQLTWTPVTFSYGYTVERGGAAVATSVTALNYTDSSLAAATTYAHRVRGCNALGCGPWSNTTSSTTRPATPTGFAYTGATTSSLSFRWDAMATSTFYRVQREAPAGSVDMTSTSTTQSDATSGATRGWRVAACNPAGCSPTTAYAYNTIGGSITHTATSVASGANGATDAHNTVHTLTVPAGVKQMRFTSLGASGEWGVACNVAGAYSLASNYGLGGYRNGTFGVTPGSNLEYFSGRSGRLSYGGWPGGAGAEAWPGACAVGGGGGGRSGVRVAGGADYVTAGGGGGGGNLWEGSAAGNAGNGTGGGTAGSGGTGAYTGVGFLLGGAGGVEGAGAVGGGSYVSACGGPCANWLYGWGYNGGDGYGGASSYWAGGGGGGRSGGGGGGGVKSTVYGIGAGGGGGGGTGTTQIGGMTNAAVGTAGGAGQGQVSICWHGSTVCGAAPVFVP